MSAPTPAPGDDRPREGYYPDPSIPGYVRYWNGASWVPGTSRPAPKDGEPLTPPPGARPAAPAVEETGPHFFDEDPQPHSAATGDAGAGHSDGTAWDATGPARGDRHAAHSGPGDTAWRADPRIPADAPAQPAGHAARTDGPASIPPADDDAPDPGTFIFRRPVPGPAAVPDDGTMTFRPVPGGPPSGQGGASTGPRTPGPTDRQPGPGAGGGPGFGPPGSAPAAGFGGQAPDSGAVSGGAGAGVAGGSGAAGHGAGAANPAAGAAGGSGAGVPGFGTQGPVGAPTPSSPSAAAASPGAPAAGPGFGAGKAAAARAAGQAPQAAQPGQAPQAAQGAHAQAPVGFPAAGGAQQAPAAPAAVAPSVPPQQAGPQPAAAGTPLTAGPGGGQASWAQQVHQLAGGADEQPVAPWKPPVEDVFQAAARRQAAARPAGLGKRLAARLIDSLVVGAATAAAAVPLGLQAADHVQHKIDEARLSGRTVTVWLLDGTTGTSLGIVLAVLLLFGVVYEVLPTAKWGRTLGKKLCGIEVRDIEAHEPPTFGPALRRWLVYSVPGLLGIGIVGVLWCLFDRPWRQCWHDKAARTFVAG
ncbi:RDD family protein [Streptomyces sp. NPDC048521]|uniref:RDD family protein n=1 Tax=Streptomyces sp. NPDC048521 TaxID=3365566 RepID=UPI003714AC63